MNLSLNTKHFTTIAIEKLYNSKKPKNKTVTRHSVNLFSTRVQLVSPLKSKREPSLYPAFTTKEMFDLEKLLILHDYLNDQIIGNPKHANFKRLKRNLHSVQSILGIPGENFIVQKQLIRYHQYNFKNSRGLSRIFSEKFSIPGMTSELRCYLFQNVYIDFDIKNSGATMLYEFIHSKLNPKVASKFTMLNKLVEARQDFYDLVSRESKVPTSKAKLLTTVVLNTHENHFKLYSRSLITLRTELHDIRLEIANYLEANHKGFIEEVVQKKFGENFKIKIEDVLNSLQSLYVGSRESFYLLELRKFLLSELEKNDFFRDELFGLDDYTEEDLYFIPLFDGAYVRHQNPLANKHLAGLVNKFNATQKYVKFVEKEITCEIANTFDLNLLEKYRNIRSFLSYITKKELNTLISYLEIETSILPANQIESFSSERLDRKYILEDFKLKLTKLKRSKKKASEEQLAYLYKQIEEIETSRREVSWENLFTKEQSKEILEKTLRFQCLLREKLLPHAESRDKLLNLLDNAKKKYESLDKSLPKPANMD